MVIARTAAELRGAGSIGGVLIPTMGALHAGHAALVRAGAGLRGTGQAVVVSVFVNPTQFNDAADLARYPRTLEADAEVCRRAGADVVFAPSVEEVYPPGEVVPTPALPGVATRPGLEDALRPGHFAGVCQVVARLFELVKPSAAVFGEKDWQQLQVVRAMVAGEGRGGRFGGVRIVASPTVREADGLAMSSRNVFLRPEERARAGAIHRALGRARGERGVEAAERAMREELEASGLEVQYAVVRDARTLERYVGGGGGGGRALVAARLGSVRLIDNAAWSG